MKKMIILAIATAFFATEGYSQNQQAAPAATTAQAATAAATEATTATAADPQDAKKEPVAADALPDAIKTALSSDAYKDYQFVSAWHVLGAAEYYEVQMKKGEEVTTIKFDKEGKQMG